MVTKTTIPTPPHAIKDSYKGYPIPYSIAWKDGVPQFQYVDPDKLRSILKIGLCGICGNVLRSGIKAWIAGVSVLTRRLWYGDPPMHQECAEYSLKVCPYLSHERVREETEEGTLPDTSGARYLILGKGIKVHQNGYMSKPANILSTIKVGG